MHPEKVGSGARENMSGEISSSATWLVVLTVTS
jgi:hypothetical protein